MNLHNTLGRRYPKSKKFCILNKSILILPFSFFFLLLLIFISLCSTSSNAQPSSAEEYIFITSWNYSFNGPADVAVDPTGNFVYVADTQNNRIQKFDSNGFDNSALPLKSWGSFGSGDGQLRNPIGITVDPTGNFVYVADTQNNRIQKFDIDGGFLLKWGSKCVISAGASSCVDPDGPTGPLSSGDGQFYSPMGMDVDKDGNVYVIDSQNNRVQKFDSNGKFITKWGQSGIGNGRFRIPSDIAVDPTGNFVYVADMNNNRVQKFDGNSTRFITKWGELGQTEGQFAYPLNIAVDPTGNFVYVADTQNDRIQKFDNNGTFITVWGSNCYLASGEGCIDPDGPTGPLSLGDGQFTSVAGIAFDPSGTFIYAIDSGNGRAQVFSLPPMIEIISYSHTNPSPDPFGRAGPRWGIDKFVLAGNSTYSASSYSVSVDWGDGTTTTGIPLRPLSGLWGYDNNNAVEHIYNSSAILNNPQKITAKLVNKNGVEKASTHSPIQVQVLPHRVGLNMPISNYSVPWNGTAIFPLTIYDFEDETPVKGKIVHFEGTGAINVIDKTTDDKGRVIGRGKAPGTVGQWQVMIYFDGAPEYTSFREPVTYNTTKHEVLLQFSISPNPVNHSENYLIEGVLFDRNTGEKLGSKQIHIIELNNGIEIGNSTTITDGKFQVRLAAPNNPSRIPLMAVFLGDDLYHGKTSDLQWLEVH